MSGICSCGRPLAVHSLGERRACQRGSSFDQETVEAGDPPQKDDRLVVSLAAHGLASSFERGCDCQPCANAYANFEQWKRAER